MSVASAPAGLSGRAWPWLWAAWSLAPAILVYWLLTTSTAALREQLTHLQFWSLELCAFLLAAGMLAVGRELRRQLTWGDLIALAAIAAVALSLTVLPPRTNRIYYDEQIYQNVGQNMGDLHLAQVCNEGAVSSGRLRCWSGEYNKQPYGYPHLLSVVYRVAGVRPAAAQMLNSAALAVTALALYLLVLVLFDDRQAAVVAALLLISIPEQLMWSVTAAAEPTASLAQVLALLAAAVFARHGSTASLMTTGVAAAYAVQFRPESVLVLPAVLLIAAPRAWQMRTEARLHAALLLCLALSAMHLAHLAAVRDIRWGSSGERFSLRFLAPNLRVNGRFFLGDARFPWIYTAAALVGWMTSVRRRAALALGVHFLCFFAIDLLFYAGSYNYGADVRYSLMNYPSLAALGGLGVSALLRWAPVAVAAPARALPVAAIAWQLVRAAPMIRAVPEEAWAARADVRFAQSFVEALPRDAFVLTHNPGMFQVWGANAGQMSMAVADPLHLRDLASKFSGGLFVHWNFWCNVSDDVQPEYCRRALAAAPSELVREATERGQRFAFYRLHVPSQ